MKTIIILILLNSFFYSQAYSKVAHDSTLKPVLYIYADKLPVLIYEGGIKEYFAKNLHWPDPMIDAEGTVLVSFVIMKNGKLASIRIERSLAKEFDDEVIRVFESMPDWKPGKKDGKAVDVKLYFPVEFKIKG
ncbi:MAG: energy transducer TonB [Ignavibacteriae bacterium]|nr:MAG: energy transducer TonB [Ignavibacteriota bacterium]